MKKLSRSYVLLKKRPNLYILLYSFISMNKKYKLIIRIFLFIFVIILPILLSIYYFPLQPFDFEREKVGNETQLTVPIGKEMEGREIIFLDSIEYDFEPSIKGAIQSVLGVPFGLDLFYVCFVDEGSKVTDIIGFIIEYDLIWHLNFSDETEFQIKANQEICVLLTKRYITKNADKITYNWAADINFSIKRNESYKPKRIDDTIHRDLGGFKISPRTKTYIIPEKYSTYTKRVLFIISWFGLCWLLTRIIFLISGYDIAKLNKK